MEKYVGGRNICLCRELTKIHEEIKWGRAKDFIEFYTRNKPRGEYVIIVAGRQREEEERLSQEEIIFLIDQKIQEGLKRNAAIKSIAKEKGLKRNDLYRIYEEGKV